MTPTSRRVRTSVDGAEHWLTVVRRALADDDLATALDRLTLAQLKLDEAAATLTAALEAGERRSA